MQDHCVTDVLHHELIEAVHAALVRQLFGHAFQRPLDVAEPPAPCMYLAHEVREMQPPAFAPWTARAEQIHQPGLATTHRAPQVDAATARRMARLAEQRLQATAQRAGPGRSGETAVQRIEPLDYRALRRIRGTLLTKQCLLVPGQRAHASWTAARALDCTSGSREWRAAMAPCRRAKSAASFSTRYTERCWPPVQPIATVM